MSTTSRLSILYLIGFILLLPLLTHTAHAQTTYDEPYGMIQLADIPTPEQRTELNDAGITLLNYARNSVWTASFAGSVDVSQFDFVVSVDELQSAHKTSDDLFDYPFEKPILERMMLHLQVEFKYG